MVSTDPDLGMKIHKHLEGRGLETPFEHQVLHAHAIQDRQQMITDAFDLILSALGLDLTDDSIQDTPTRMGKMYTHEIFQGLNYNNFPKCSLFENKAKVDEMVVVRKILVRSVCEHHLVPFVGYAYIGYIPKKSLIGLSKFNRIVDFFCRRPQVQERLTEQIAAALTLILGTDDVAVYIDAEHMCVKLRGIQDPHSSTVTSKVSGRFKKVTELRNEFLTTIKE